MPKRYNFVPVADTNYGTCEGFEYDIAASIAKRIGEYYGGGEAFKAYFTLSPWQASYQDNLVSNMYENKYDFIMSGMSIEGEWPNLKCDDATHCPDGEPNVLNRTQVLDFTCGYQDSTYGAVLGTLPLPDSVTVTTVKDLDAPGILICAQKGTSMATMAHNLFPTASVVEIENGAEVTNRTIYRDGCHAYIAPIINAAWDGDTNAKLQFIGKLGVSDGTLAIGIRKENEASLAIRSPSFDIVVVVVAALISVVLSLFQAT